MGLADAQPVPDRHYRPRDLDGEARQRHGRLLHGQAQLDRFYNCIHTPIGDNEPHLEPFTLPDDVVPEKPKKLINTADMEIPMPTAVGAGGFLFFCLMVVVLIGFVYWLAQVGPKESIYVE